MTHSIFKSIKLINPATNFNQKDTQKPNGNRPKKESQQRLPKTQIPPGWLHALQAKKVRPSKTCPPG